MRRVVDLSPEDVADLRREVLFLTDYLANQGEPDTDERRETRARHERRLSLMHRLLADRA